MTYRYHDIVADHLARKRRGRWIAGVTGAIVGGSLGYIFSVMGWS